MPVRRLGRIYVTGADGFIGSHLVETLVARGDDVTALCVYNSMGSYGWLNELARTAPKNLQMLLGDVRDPYFMTTTMDKHDTVFHLAALIAIPYSYVAAQSYIATNVSGTLNVVEAARKAKVQRLVHTSTSEVYGTAQTVPISETHPLQGQSPYSASKIGADMLVESYVRSFGVPATTLRPFNTYGPRQSLRAITTTVMAQILAGQKELHLGNITPTRDLNYVADTVAAFVALGECTNEAVLGETYNAGSGREISIEALVHLVAKTLDRTVTIVCDEQRVRPELSEVQRLLADSSKLTLATGWQSRVPLEQGLLNLAQWMRQADFATDVMRYSV